MTLTATDMNEIDLAIDKTLDEMVDTCGEVYERAGIEYMFDALLSNVTQRRRSFLEEVHGR